MLRFPEETTRLLHRHDKTYCWNQKERHGATKAHSNQWYPNCHHPTSALLTPSYPGIEFTSVHHDVYPAIDLRRSTFEGRRVFISGASKGIGRETAIAYAKAGAAAICLGARSDLSLVEQDVQEAAAAAGKKPPKVLTVNLDVSSRRSVEAAANAVAQCCESIDVLVNNAGYHSRFETITESDPDDWWKSWETVRLPTSSDHVGTTDSVCRRTFTAPI